MGRRATHASRLVVCTHHCIEDGRACPFKRATAPTEGGPQDLVGGPSSLAACVVARDWAAAAGATVLSTVVPVLLSSRYAYMRTASLLQVLL